MQKETGFGVPMMSITVLWGPGWGPLQVYRRCCVWDGLAEATSPLLLAVQDNLRADAYQQWQMDAGQQLEKSGMCSKLQRCM